MTRSLLSAFLIVAIVVACTGRAQAQLFGTRQLGVSKYGAKDSSSAGTGAAPGTALQGNERFIRGNRTKSDFVGTGSKDSRGFVGMEQASTKELVQSAVDNLTIETSPDANKNGQPQPPRATMYQPRLAVGFGFAPAPPPSFSSGLQGRLTSSPAIRWAGPCEVILEGRMATLRGKVASERDRKLAELFVLFEPGISRVQNQLQVVSPLPTTNPAAPMTAPSPSDRLLQPPQR